MRTPSSGLPWAAAAALAMSPRRTLGRYAKCDDPSDSLVPSTPWEPAGSSARPPTCPTGGSTARTIAAVAGGGGGKGTRTVASYDEDTTTMGVEAARAALRPLDGLTPHTLWFSTVAPAYADKTNATTIHAALQLGPDVGAFDANGSVRSAMGALHAALSGRGAHLVVSADLRSGLAGGADESAFGDGAAALVIGDDGDGPVLAELIGGGWATEEFLDRWRTPGDTRSKVWEERFGETRYVPLGQAAWDDALKTAGLVADQVDHVAIAGTHGRANAALAKKLGAGDRLVADHAGTVGNLGAAQPAFLLTAALEAADPRPGDRARRAGRRRPRAALPHHRRAGRLVARPPGRGAGRRRRADPVRHLPALAGRPPGRAAPPARAGPPLRVGLRSVGATGSSASSGPRATPATSTCRPSRATPPPCRWPTPPAPSPRSPSTGSPTRRARPSCSRSSTSTAAVGCRWSSPTSTSTRCASAHRVELTFRKLFTADGIHNYFWKARLR